MKKLITNITKILGASVIAAAMVGCTGNPYVESADRNEIITLGDSIFDLSGEIQANLEAQAGQTFRDYTQSGAELSGGALATAVDTQYSDARATDPNIETIVMDGGGNDILIPASFFDPYGCRTHWYRWHIKQSCIDLIADQYVTAVNLLNQMDADGVSNVIWLGYYELPRGNENLTEALNYGDAYLGYACETATTANCQFVDPRGQIAASDVKSDDIHPTSSGSQKLSDMIWPVLQPLL